MIFVTVGTHEQSFRRLLKELDDLVSGGAIREDVFAQRGFGKYVPQNYPSEELLPYDEVVQYVNKASIVITHGGPGSIMLPLAAGKVPIVVPRQARYHEHVDDHQVRFVRRLESIGRILAVYDISALGQMIASYEELQRGISRTGLLSEGTDLLTRNLETYCEAIERRRPK